MWHVLGLVLPAALQVAPPVAEDTTLIALDHAPGVSEAAVHVPQPPTASAALGARPLVMASAETSEEVFSVSL